MTANRAEEKVRTCEPGPAKVETTTSFSNLGVEMRYEDVQKLQLLGTGSWGTVHKVEAGGNMYALKSSETALTEQGTLLACDSAFIVKCFQTFVADGTTHLLMELGSGADVEDLFVKKSLFGREAAVQFIVAGVLLALEHLHSKSILHRDIKAANTVLTRQGHVKLVDFGASKFATDKCFTRSGTPLHWAPEVLKGGYSFEVDWYSLGCLVYFLLCGSFPFQAATTAEQLIKAILKGKLLYPAPFCQRTKPLVQGLCARDPSKRFSSPQVRNHDFYGDFDFVLYKAGAMQAPYCI